MNQPDDRLSGRNLWAYTLGSVGRDTAVALFSSFLLTFVLFTKTLDEAQFSVISIVMIAGRIINGLNDPFMGNVLEVTRTKWGKFKPWIAVGTLLCAGIYIISFNNRSVDGWNYVTLFSVLYIAYSFIFTINDISYWGMLPSLASRKDDRDLLTSRTILFAGIGQALAVIIVPTFTAGELTLGGNAITAYSLICMVFVILFVGMQGITIFGVKEKPLPPKGGATVNKVALGTIVRTIKNNDQLMLCMAIYLLHTVSSGLINSVIGTNYIFFEFGYNGSLVMVFSALGAGVAVPVMMFFSSISKRFTRNQLMKMAIWGTIAGSAFMLLTGMLVPAAASGEIMYYVKFALLMIGNLFAFTGQNVFYLVTMICIANTIEYNEWKTGARAEGIIFSVRPFITKVGSAVIQGAVMVVFLLTGVRQYTNQIANLENQAEKGFINAVQKTAGIEAVIAGVPSDKSAALLFCMTVLPCLFALAAYYLYSRKFNITEERYEEILAELKERKETEAAV